MMEKFYIDRIKSIILIKMIMKMLITVLLVIGPSPNESISAYWTPILPKVCGTNVSKNLTQSLFACDQLLDHQLSNIFDDCVQSVYRLKRNKIEQRPKLCYYMRMGNQLDRCKMARYQSERITLTELIDREQDHTITNPIKKCFQEEIVIEKMESQQRKQSSSTSPLQPPPSLSSLSSSPSKLMMMMMMMSSDRKQSERKNSERIVKPSACLAFQYSRKIWKCLAERYGDQSSFQNRANLYITCLRSIQQPVQ
ncbi:hypothetical protein SSS_09193 [Sarcoptes scabiei]|uniref:Uncharacterized protein n=1 Tax=Sarcoptes scabiei TaxID=52283 RepID=A0A834R575_SARSC|nr:hypothetical protein SSS_09193 [Sarcoptes scabiei]